MSYDFLMFKPLVDVQSMDDLREEAVATLSGPEVMRELSQVFPALRWRRFGEGESHDHFSAAHQDDETWYEFSVNAGESKSWSIRTSHRASERGEIAAICRRLGHIAFDGQVMRLVRTDGTVVDAVSG